MVHISREQAHADERHARGMDDRYRADADGFGRWSVWQRISGSGWVLRTPCGSRAEALGLAASLNRETRPAS